MSAQRVAQRFEASAGSLFERTFTPKDLLAILQEKLDSNAQGLNRNKAFKIDPSTLKVMDNPNGGAHFWCEIQGKRGLLVSCFIFVTSTVHNNTVHARVTISDSTIST